MKKILLIFLAVALVFSCQKKEVQPVQVQQDVVFDISNLTPGAGLKSTADDPIICSDEEPVSAEIKITFPDLTINTYYPSVFRLDGKLYTQAIKLPASETGATSYTVTKFLLKDENGNIVMATPETTSKYAPYISQGKTVSFSFDVDAFKKAEIPVEVLCFQPEDYLYFGFNWYHVTEIVIREQCFFGDICLDGDYFTPDDFNGSLYGDDLGVDVPAIMQIKVYKDGVEVPNSPFDNEDYLGTGAPLCVQYPDNLQIDNETFTFELYLWTPDDQGVFSYQLYYTYTAVDDGDLDVPDIDNDGINDFVVGDCNYNPADLQLYPPDQQPPGGGQGCETAFAYGGSYANCFLDLDEIKTNRWGWTNGELDNDATYTFDIYAAAGQCDLSKGTLVGTLTVNYNDDNTVDVTYSMNSPYTLDEVHLYVGNDILPKKNGHYTVAPGQYPYKAENLNGASTYTFSGIVMDGNDIYVVAHAVVCGF